MIWKLGSLCETKEKIMEMGWQVAAGGLWHWKGFKLHSQQLCQVHCHRVCLPACHSECSQVSFQTSYLHISQANHVNSRATCAFSTEIVPNTDAQMHMFCCHYISVMMWEPKGWSGLQVALMSWLQPQHHERKKKKKLPEGLGVMQKPSPLSQGSWLRDFVTVHGDMDFVEY